jgi:hypothetical protein
VSKKVYGLEVKKKVKKGKNGEKEVKMAKIIKISIKWASI